MKRLRPMAARRNAPRVRGQWIILTALAVVVAAAVIYMAYVATSITPLASVQRPAYGIMSQNWPELVQLLAGYTAFLAQSGASKVSTAALEAGLYNNLVQGYPSSYFQLQSASQYLRQALQAVEQSLIPLGTFVTANYSISQGGFGGTLGPYPAAVVLSDSYNFTYWWLQGALSAPGAYKVYRFVVTPYTSIQSDYVIIYSADVRRPASIGEPYNEAVSEILKQAQNGNGYDASLLKRKLYLILVNNTALREALAYYANQLCNYHNPNVVEEFNEMLSKAFVQLPWWSEYLKCPFCLFDFKMPRGSLTSPGVSDEVMVVLYNSPTDNVYLTLNIPLMLSLFGITPSQPFCYDPANYYYTYQVPAFPDLNNNPYATYTIGGSQWFVSAAGLYNWPSAIVESTCHIIYPPQSSPTPIKQLIPTSVYGNSTQGLLLGAVYPAGIHDVGYQIWNNYSIPSSWPGFQVRVLVNVTTIGREKMGYLALFWGGYDGGTFPWCADMVAVQPESYPPSFVWSYLPNGIYSGPWQTYLWDYGGSFVGLEQGRWYVLSISGILQGNNAGNVYLSVYKFLSNNTGPMTQYVGQWISAQLPLSFNVVLGTDTEDFPQSSSTPWSNAAVYDFLAIRPWTYPEPSAVLTALGSAPVVDSPRRVVLAWGNSSYVNARASAVGNISLALVVGLNITQSAYVNASASRAFVYPFNTTHVRYSYGVLVKSNVPRSALGASFTLYINTGNVLYNYTCGITNICNLTLVTYYGYSSGVDSALYNLTFLVPKYSSFSPVLRLLGAQLAVNNLTLVHPQVYYLWSGNSLYLINVGNMDALFYFPWRSGQPVVQSVSPNDGVFGARLDISNGSASWTLVMVPPRSAVNVTLYPAYVQQIQGAFPTGYAPVWELKYVSPIQIASGCRVLQVYFPSAYAGSYFVLVIPPSLLTALGFSDFTRLNMYVFTKSGWSGPLAYSVAAWNDVWVKIVQSPGWFAYRGTLLEICPSSQTTARSLSQVVDLYVPKTSSSSYTFSTPVSLLNYPSGFAVIVNMTLAVKNGYLPSRYLQYIYLANSTNTITYCVEGSPAGRLLEFYNGYLTGIPGWNIWWNQYASVCADQYVWTTYGNGIEAYFIFALTPQFANFHIATVGGSQLNPYSSWWYNGWPNTAYSPVLLTTNPPCSNLQSCNGPMWSFNNLYVGWSGSTYYGIDVIPYMWPLPYFVLNGKTYQTI